MKNSINIVGDAISQLHESRRDAAMVALLVTQAITVYGLIPATASQSNVPVGLVGVLPLLFSALVVLITRTEWTFAIGSIAFALSVAIIVLDCFQQYPLALLGADVLAIATFLLLTVAIFATVFAPGRFSVYRALGAIVIYLNIGLLFTLVFRLITLLSVSAFSGLPQVSDHSGFRATLEYFSFSTLTSVGFGDILPVSPMARGLTILEASVGHLYPATVLARIVSMAMQARGEHHENEAGETKNKLFAE
ncbi:ion channel [Paraburkholderia pallida]|nr:ion channel [Paraburkholderia pallida]